MQRQQISGGGLLKGAAAAGVVAAVGGLGLSRFGVRHDLPLPPALPGEHREFDGRRAGRLSAYVDGQGPPLLLVHSINAAGSAYEVKPIYEPLRASRRVYAIDLPGFGFSDRSDRPYAVRLYVDAIHDALDEIAREEGPDRPVDALALSLSSEFLARAATERPERFRTLALVTPTGFNRGSERLRRSEGGSREIPGLHTAFTVPVWSQALYDLLVSRRSIRFFLERTFGSKRIDEGLLDYDYLTTHQPGAKNAPFAFVSGRLFSRDARDLYERLTMPVWMPHGTKGDFGDFSEADNVRSRPNWAVEPFDTGALPQFERPEVFLASYERFLDEAAAAETASPPVSPSLRAPPVADGVGAP